MLPNLELLQTYNLSCGKDTFLEILIMSIKGSSLAHQHDFFKIKNAKRKMLENKIKELKKILLQTKLRYYVLNAILTRSWMTE